MDSPSPPRSLLIKPASGDCNLHCTYCFYHDRATDPYKQVRQHRMSNEVLDALIRQGMGLDRRHATFGWQGGEPTLAGLDFFQQVVELQQRYGRPGQAVSNGIQTNGLLLDDEWADFLHQYRVLLGVSLDGPAEYHDRYRVYANGQPTHDRVLASLRRLEQHDVEFNVLAVVNNITSQHGGEIYDYFQQQGFTYMQFIPCVEYDRDTGRMTDFTVAPEQFGDFMCDVFDRWYNNGEPETSNRDFEAILSTYVGQGPTLCCYQERCGSYLVVEYNGDVYPCDFLVREDLYLGNIMETPLEQIFASDKLAEFARAKAEPRPECQACAWQPYCNQGCPRFLHEGIAPKHYLCQAYQRFFAHSHAGFLDLRDRLLKRWGVNPSDVALPPALDLSRNAPCPCGSGKKFKNCCGRPGRSSGGRA